MDRITSLFGIKYPIIQGGMVWCSGWRLASAVSNAGGLGLLGAGSMHPDTLREHIQKCRAATHHSFGVNIPLMYPQIEEVMQIVAEEGVRIVLFLFDFFGQKSGFKTDRYGRNKESFDFLAIESIYRLVVIEWPILTSSLRAAKAPL